MSNSQEPTQQNINPPAGQSATSQQPTPPNSRDQPPNRAPNLHPSYTTADLGLRSDSTQAHLTSSDKRVTNGV
ncbi:hypothetical protein COCSADRAFT_34672 [Bipolaris sorokiniana ND90Pr]|uniref:Uncharacterized protein n=1 Tax=Cochliobolus sativus (strain ND90Pr / ATCC 201652) TaxID=665912 RepID=M2TA62_COCSN|nr:uncharacterized protein COCSADRAFT_34672 [Bipolaris sorokiniana ND90Pr]EMD66081.1 hypothetical protein COCSADRAFT_34672 [Bipolaris sorokiniana ND90Pr]